MKHLAAILVSATALGSAQTPVDVSKIGLTVGASAPAFSGVDQNGVTQSLQSVAGRKGTMLVFFRSADW